MNEIFQYSPMRSTDTIGIIPYHHHIYKSSVLNLMTQNSDNIPVIGITSESENGAEQYVKLVQQKGAYTEILIPNQQITPKVNLENIDGLLITCEDETDLEQCDSSNGYDSATYQIISTSLQLNIPMLCICKGMLTLNLVTDGKPSTNIHKHNATMQKDGGISSYHHIYISPGSKLATIVGSGGFVRVNSRHSKGISESQKSPTLLASAYSLEDGIIEAVESPYHHWVIGVQFHPERRREIPPHFDRLFDALITAASQDF